MANLARAIEGIPVILQAERDTAFPTPERDQRYQDRTTGTIYRYDGSSWAVDMAGSKGPVFDVRAYGAVGDGVADDASAVTACFAAAAVGPGTVVFPLGAYRFDTVPVVASGVSVILHAGVTFPGAHALVTAATNHVLDLGLVAQIRSDASSGQDVVAIGTAALAAYGTPSSSGSVAVGYHALTATTTGDNNVAVGHYALEHNVSSSNSTAVGVMALRNATAANQTAVGSSSAMNTTTGSGNTAVGVSALQDNTTGFDNVAVGVDALLQSVTASNSVAIGARAIFEPTTGANNVAVGVEALYGNITSLQGTENFLNSAAITAAFTLGTGWANGGTYLDKNADGTGTATSIDGIYDYGVGATYTVSYTIANLTAGSVTVSFGGVADPSGARSANGTYSFSCTPTTDPAGLVFTPSNTSRFRVTAATVQGTSTSSADSNTGIGTGALYMTTSGANNVAIGQGAHRQHTSGADNVAVGVEALTRNGSGSKNTAVGRLAGYGGNSASRGIFVGYMAGRYETASNTLIVDAFDRTNEATARTSAILYGLMNATPSSQALTVNGTLTVSYGIAITANDLTITAGFGLAVGGTRVVTMLANGIALNASTTAGASLRVAHGAAPTSPVNGDIWTTTAGLFVRINGVTKTVTLT